MRDLRETISETVAVHYDVPKDLLNFQRGGRKGLGDERMRATRARRMMLALAYHFMPTATQKEVAEAMGSSNPHKVREAVRIVNSTMRESLVYEHLRDVVYKALWKEPS